jgi:hypothetical protein
MCFVSYVLDLEQHIEELQEQLAVSEAKVEALQRLVPRWEDAAQPPRAIFSWYTKYMINGICLATIRQSITDDSKYHVDMSPPVQKFFTSIEEAKAHVEVLFGPKYAA